MENKHTQNIEIQVSTADQDLGIANVILALKECGLVEIPAFLDALDLVTSRTRWKDAEGQWQPSQHSRDLAKHLRKLESADYSVGKPR
jgi:hypothetical protein